jgi:CheY-like chemotaxis protein
VKELRPILLVEDSEQDAELALNALEEHHIANAVVVVRDGAEALDYLFRRGEYTERPPEDPAVVLLDVKMPRVDGLQVLRELKADDHLRLVPVVMLTSSREERDLMESYRLGANAFVVKPVDFQQFMEAIRQIGAFWAVLNETAPQRARS